MPKYPHIDAYISEGFNIGFPLILFLVYFTIFLFYKPNKSNLWFSLWGASISLTAFLSLLSKLTTLISLQNTYTSWASIFSSFGTICLIFSIYLLLNQKHIWTIIGFIILVTISTVNYFLPNNSDPRIFDFVILLFYIGLIVYMSLNAIKSGNEGGKYVIIGIVFFIVFWTIFIFDLLGFNKSTLIAAVNYHIAALSLPIIVATLLGLEFRNTNKSLLKNLEDIKKLSAEKQEILTTQNETLEKQVTERTAELVHKNRDLEIEGALEKIRSTSLAMRHSDEIKNVVTVLFEKLKELNLVFDAAAIHVFREGNKNASIWVASPEQLSSATEISLPYDEDAFENNPIILDVWNAKESGCHIFNKIYPFELKNRYFNYVFKHNDYEKVPEFVRNIILNAECYTATFVSEKNSLLGVNSWTKQLFSPTDFEILKRVARVFEQAYTRFLDLQKAEAQAREAKVEVALEKIRSRSLAMHHSNELNDVIAIMLDKLKELNVLLGTVALQFFDEKTKNSFLLVGSDLNEKPQMIYLPYDEKIFNEDTYLKDSWQAKISGESIINKKYSLEQKNKYFEYVFANNDLTVVPQPVRDFILQTQSHITCLLIEKNSALFVDSWHGQVYNEEMLKVLKRASIVFEQAYVRFLDLKKAETLAEQAKLDLILIQTEKKRAEDALVALKQTQTQLIQSEKLASLGELTAGIAHEIQNPLNFVNNFSELSEELIDEMNDEIDKGNNGEVKAIASDLKLNLEKIHHHGKRASGIVKAMLEHSRTSTGNKELTNINTLADEYLRLSYHGLRAQDKTFNADFKAELDPNLPLIDAIPQDLGRVFLNLINNAFYACNERAKQNIKNGNHGPYKPMVIVSTQKTEDKIEIKVKDNGSGISEENIEKIFQPFFTTKPTGKGTGLGLSLSYDIVTKGHGGSLEVESEKNIGTSFTIKLPIS